MALSDEMRDRLCDRAEALECEKRLPGMTPEMVKWVDGQIATIDRMLEAN